MEIKKKILKSIIWTDDDILYIASHHVFAYFWVIVVTIVMITITFFSYSFLKILSLTFATWVAWILWVIIYMYFILNFLDIYLDSIVVTSDSITIYKWYGLFKSTTDVIEFDAIESVFYEQEWIINVLFDDGDLFIRRAMHTNVFNSIHNPSHVVENINKIKQEAKSWETKEETKEENKNNSDFDVFVEAMSEIIRDYKNK